ncbi:MAG: thioredoxin family protein [Bacteroidetes bacterium]|nr:thioredoxin family protein [Bacteroidota bacterium]
MHTPARFAEINTALLESAMSWEDYNSLLERLMSENKTTGPDQSEYMINYARLNLQRMKRIGKTVSVLPELKAELGSITRKLSLLFITEGWCGDAAQTLGVVKAMANEIKEASVKVILRDEHTAVMDHFLTNGGRAIPIVVVIDAGTLEVLGHWGPRPAALQQLIAQWKEQGLQKEQFIEKVHTWYAADKTRTTQLDFASALRSITG